jgi:hypothetical protein
MCPEDKMLYRHLLKYVYDVLHELFRYYPLCKPELRAEIKIVNGELCIFVDLVINHTLTVHCSRKIALPTMALMATESGNEYSQGMSLLGELNRQLIDILTKISSALEAERTK